MTNLKAVIIDDEEAARSFLSSLIEEFVEGIEIVGTSQSALEGVKLLKNVHADILFVDIEMPGGSGFDFLEAIDEKKYKVVFTTAHQEFAIKAINYGADGYILKPVDLDDLEELLAKLRKDTSDTPSDNNRVAFRTHESIEYVDSLDIIRVEGDGNYSSVYLKNGKKIIISKNMKQIENMLQMDYFIKTHKSYLINTKHILRFIKTDGGYFEMVDGAHAPVSRRKKEEILKMMEH